MENRVGSAKLELTFIEEYQIGATRGWWAEWSDHRHEISVGQMLAYLFIEDEYLW